VYVSRVNDQMGAMIWKRQDGIGEVFTKESMAVDERGELRNEVGSLIS